MSDIKQEYITIKLVISTDKPNSRMNTGGKNDLHSLLWQSPQGPSLLLPSGRLSRFQGLTVPCSRTA